MKTILNWLDERTGWRKLKEALLKGFQTSLGVRFYEGTLTPKESDLSQTLAREKYRTFDWSHHGKYETGLAGETAAPGEIPGRGW